MTVREPASLAEYRAVLEVIGAAWRAAFADVVSLDAIANVAEFPEFEDLPERFAEQRDREEVLFLVAAEIRSLYVHPDHWERGIGTALLDAIERRVPDDLDRLALETLCDVAPTRAFYEAKGFELTGKLPSRSEEEYPTVIYERQREC